MVAIFTKVPISEIKKIKIDNVPRASVIIQKLQLLNVGKFKSSEVIFIALGEASKQVIVVTHSPQVAAFGNDHFVVKKKIVNNQSAIELKKLDEKEKLNEIARMLSGKEITEEAINAARKLITYS